MTENIMKAMLILVLVMPGLATAAVTEELPLSAGGQLADLDRVPSLRVAGMARSLLADQDSSRAAEGRPYRYALPRRVDRGPADAGSWETLADGNRVWRWRLDCEGALSVGLGFSSFRLPPGGRLLVFGATGSGPVYAFDAGDNAEHGQLWTPVLLTDEVVLELVLPPVADAEWDLQLGTVGWGYRYFGEEPAEKSGPCNIDVICAEGDDWREEIATVGVYTIGASWKCTGVMVNNTAQDERPLFLTADHCEVTPAVDQTVVIYWNYESPVCGQQGGGSLDQFSTGTTLLATYAGSDFTLLELEESPPEEFGVNFAGWDRSAAVPDNAVCIHHPSTDEKSISFENDPLSITSYLQDVGPGNSTHLRVADWDLGTTEGGSSGSPLFNAERLIVGQLHGGYAACDNDLPDWYGRLYVSWAGGGAPDSRLSDWLDPEGLGVTSLPLLVGGDDPIVPPPLPAENANIRVIAVAPNPFLDYAEFRLEVDRNTTGRLKIFNVAGRLVADLGKVELQEGDDNLVAWGGNDDEGGRAGSGMYFLVVAADGKTARRSFTRLN